MADLTQQMTLADLMRNRAQASHPVMPESKRSLADLMRGGLMGVTTDVLGAPVDLATLMMRPFGYQHPKPVGGSDWLAEKLTRPTGSPAETGARMLSGLLSPDAGDLLKLAPLMAGITVNMRHASRNPNLTEFSSPTRRGAVYLAHSDDAAKKGAEASQMQAFSDMDMVPASGQEFDQLTVYDVTGSPKVWGDDFPKEIPDAPGTVWEEYAREYKTLKNKTRKNAVERAKESLLKEFFGGYDAAQDASGAWKSIRNNRAYSMDWQGFEHVDPYQWPETGVPDVQQALRELGYQAMWVNDEAGKSLAVIDPQTLKVVGKVK